VWFRVSSTAIIAQETGARGSTIRRLQDFLAYIGFGCPAVLCFPCARGWRAESRSTFESCLDAYIFSLNHDSFDGATDVPRRDSGS